MLITSITLAGLAWAAKFTYTPANTATDVWSAGTDWDVTPVSAATTQLTFVGANGTVLANGLANINTNGSATPFSLNILDLQGTGPATGGASVTINSSSAALNFIANGATNPVVNLAALAGASGLTYNVGSNLTFANNVIFQGAGTAAFNFTGNLSTTGTATFTKNGASNLTLTGTTTLGTGNTIFNGGTTTITGSGSLSSTGKIQIGVSGAATVIFSSTATSTFNIPSNFFGVGDSQPGTLDITNGTVSVTTGQGFFVGNAAAGTVDVSGGNLTLAATSIVYLGGIPTFGSANGNGTLTVDGTGTIALNGSAALKFGTFNAGARGTLNIGNGIGTGTLVTSRSFARDVGSGTVNFNGGILKANAGINNASWISGLTNVFIKSGGAFIDTNGQAMGIPQSLLTDTVSLGGGLTKLGAGTLAISGTNTYTGPTTVSAGTLQEVSAGGLGATSSISIASGATLDLGNAVTAAVTLGAQSGPALLLADGSALRMDLGGAGSNDKITLPAGTTASAAGTATLNLVALSGITVSGTYTLISAPGGGLERARFNSGTFTTIATSPCPTRD